MLEGHALKRLLAPAPGREFATLDSLLIERGLAHDPPGFVVELRVRIASDHLLIRAAGTQSIEITPIWQLDNVMTLQVAALPEPTDLAKWKLGALHGDLTLTAAEIVAWVLEPPGRQ